MYGKLLLLKVARKLERNIEKLERSFCPYRRMKPNVAIWASRLGEVHKLRAIPRTPHIPSTSTYMNFFGNLGNIPRDVLSTGSISYHHYNLT
jgi:hypothetical protein